MSSLPAVLEGVGGVGAGLEFLPPSGQRDSAWLLATSDEASVLSPSLQAGSWCSPTTSPAGALMVMSGKRTSSAISSPVCPVPGLKPCALGVEASQALRCGAQKEQGSSSKPVLWTPDLLPYFCSTPAQSQR